MNGVVWGLIFAMVVLGLSLTFGLMNVAHSSFYMLGAMVTATLTSRYGYGFAPSVAIAVVAVTALGFIANALVFSRVVGGDPLIGLLATAGLLLVLDSAALALFGSAPIAVDAPVQAYVEVLGVFYPAYRLVVAGIAVAAIGAAFAFIRFTRYGLWMRAVPQSRELAEIAGVSKRRVSQITIVLAASLAVVVGGGASLAGALAIAVLLGVARGVAATFLPPTVAEVASLGALLPLLAARPDGLFGARDG